MAPTPKPEHDLTADDLRDRFERGRPAELASGPSRGVVIGDQTDNVIGGNEFIHTEE